jgi:predicted transcriptional regulator
MSDYQVQEENLNIISSGMAFDILHILHTSEEELYSKEIAERLQTLGYNTSRESVSNYLKKLREFNYIKRGKRTQAQYYHLDIAGIYVNWTTLVLSNLEGSLGLKGKENTSIEETINEIENQIEEEPEKYSPEDQEEIDVEQVKEVTRSELEEWKQTLENSYESFKKEAKENEELQDFMNIFFLNGLRNPGANLMQLYTTEIFHELVILRTKNDELPEELNTVLTALSSLQTHESLLFGAGTQAYQKVYGKH